VSTCGHSLTLAVVRLGLVLKLFESMNGSLLLQFTTSGPWDVLKAMRRSAWVQFPVCPDPPSFCTGSWAGCVLGFWWLPVYELLVYSSVGSEAEAQSEYGVATE
jgi:hypothetical protein